MAIVQEFTYRAIDPRGGGVVKGSMEAASESAVTGKLRAQGLTPLEITALSKTGLNREIKLPGFGGTVKAKSLAIFTRQMAGLLNAGLPLMRTLVDPHRADGRQEAAARARRGAGRYRGWPVVLERAGAASRCLPAAHDQHRAGR